MYRSVTCCLIAGLALTASSGTPLAASRAEHLVPEIPVARLRVHELVPAGICEPCGGAVGIDDSGDLVVCQHAHARGESSVEDGMGTRSQRCRRVPHIRARETPGVRELQS